MFGREFVYLSVLLQASEQNHAAWMERYFNKGAICGNARLGSSSQLIYSRIEIASTEVTSVIGKKQEIGNI
jgi:hypothetical protein